MFKISYINYSEFTHQSQCYYGRLFNDLFMLTCFTFFLHNLISDITIAIELSSGSLSLLSTNTEVQFNDV